MVGGDNETTEESQCMPPIENSCPCLWLLLIKFLTPAWCLSIGNRGDYAPLAY